ncbi:hypothetical protein CHUAL_005666 [Chamberlinius hualienensis]
MEENVCYSPDEHIYEEIVYRTPNAEVDNVPKSNPSNEKAKQSISRSKSWANLHVPSSNTVTSLFRNILPSKSSQPPQKCHCCQATLGHKDTIRKSFTSKSLKCIHCHNVVCLECYDDLHRCHECFVRLTTIFDPLEMLRMRTSTLLGLIKSLHYPIDYYINLHKAYLVKQLLTRFNKHPEWNPNVFIQQIEAHSSSSKPKHKINEKQHNRQRHHRHHKHRDAQMTKAKSHQQLNCQNSVTFEERRKTTQTTVMSNPTTSETLKTSSSSRPKTTSTVRSYNNTEQFIKEPKFSRTQSVDGGLDNWKSKKPSANTVNDKIALFESMYAVNGNVNPPTTPNVRRRTRTSRRQHLI